MKNLPEPGCHCGSGKPVPRCCGRYLEGTATAPDAEALMRSRYVAYVLMQEPYLLATWHASTRPASLDLTPTQWIGLTIRHHEQQDTDHATVEFVARYKINGRAHRLHETSRFVREGGRWLYVAGEIAV
jgi:SEC-C motif-containing protein